MAISNSNSRQGSLPILPNAVSPAQTIGGDPGILSATYDFYTMEPSVTIVSGSATTTGNWEGKNSAGAAQWTVGPTSINASATKWVGNGSHWYDGVFLYLFATDAGNANLYSATVNVQTGAVTPIGTAIASSVSLNTGVLTSSGWRAARGAGNIFITNPNGSIEVNPSTGAITSEDTTKKLNGMYAFGAEGQYGTQYLQCFASGDPSLRLRNKYGNLKVQGVINGLNMAPTATNYHFLTFGDYVAAVSQSGGGEHGIMFLRSEFDVYLEEWINKMGLAV